MIHDVRARVLPVPGPAVINTDLTEPELLEFSAESFLWVRIALCSLLSPLSPLLIAAAGSAQAQKQFRWKFADGDRYSVQVAQDVKQTVAIADQTVEIPAKITMDLTWKVDSVDEDGTAAVLQTVDQVVINMTIPGVDKDVSYDSSSKDEATPVIAPIADVIDPMIGVEFTQKMDPSGRILEVTVPKDAFKGLETNQMLKQFFSGEAFKQMISKASAVFPEEAIEIGHSWENQAKQETPTWW